MIAYKYKARTDKGEVRGGMIEAIDEIEATARLREQFASVISVQPVKRRGGSGASVTGFLSKDIGRKRLNPKAFVLMCSQFATILSAGIPVARAIRLIGAKTADKTLKALLANVAEDVEAGRSMSAAFEDHGATFLPKTFVETLRAGEEAGDLSSAFDSIWRHFDKQTKMAGKVRAAMRYPLFVLAVAVIVVMVLMVKVVPTFTEIFESQGNELPIMTQILIGFSTFVQHTFLQFVIIVAVLVGLFILYKNTPRGKLNVAKLAMAMPIFGNIAELNASSLFANTMATMIGAGLPITKAVAITAEVMTNEWIKQQSLDMVSKIEEGRTIVDAMREANCFPEILTDMVGVGEETGEMKETLDTVAKFYDDELENAVAAALAMLEPALMLFIAFVAGFIVIAVYMSMFDMYSAM